MALGLIGRIWLPPPPLAVAAGILPAVEPGILPGGMVVGVGGVVYPGGKMPAAAWWLCPDMPSPKFRRHSGRAWMTTNA